MGYMNKLCRVHIYTYHSLYYPFTTSQFPPPHLSSKCTNNFVKTSVSPTDCNNNIIILLA